MKKFLALLTAAILLLAAVPALAFTGYDEEPAMPETVDSEEKLFDVRITRMKNEPDETQTPWGETMYTWVPMGSDPKADKGETVTYAVEYQLPATLEGYTEEQLNQIRLIVVIYGLSEVEIADATGLEPNQTCDYEAGYCYPLPGYYNAYVESNGLFVEPKLNTSVQIIIRGVVSLPFVRGAMIQAIGQTVIPTHFSVGKIEHIDGGYYVYDKDFTAVQIRGMKFFTEDDHFDHYYVCLNDIDYIRDSDSKTIVYYRVDDEDTLITSGPKFEALERGYNDVMNFFGFTDDDVHDVMTDSVFLANTESVTWLGNFDVMTDEPGEEPEPTEPAPTEPGEEPEPTEPAEPGDEPVIPDPPVTGTVSLTALGVASLIAGACVISFRRKEDR